MRCKNNKQVKHINITNLPESNTREIPSKQCASVSLTLNSSRQLRTTNHLRKTGFTPTQDAQSSIKHAQFSVTQQCPLPDLNQLLAVQLPLVRIHQAVGPSQHTHPAKEEIMSLFSRVGTYHVAVNAIARILQWRSGEMFYEAQQRAEHIIFQVFQMNEAQHLNSFRGNGFKLEKMTRHKMYLSYWKRYLLRTNRIKIDS